MPPNRTPFVRTKNLNWPIRVHSVQSLLKTIKTHFPDFRYDQKIRLNQDLLIVTPQGFEELCFHTHWGKKHPQNLAEIKFRGIGYVFTDGLHEFFLVCYVQYLLASDRNSEYVGPAYIELQEKDLEFYSKDFSLNPFGKEFGAPNVIFMGHTHPGNLSTQMSHTDRNTHHEAMRSEQAMSVIVNPHTKKISAYVGSELKSLCVLIPKSDISPATKKAPMKKSYKCAIDLSSDEICAKITFITKRLAFITFNKSVRLIDFVESED